VSDTKLYPYLCKLSQAYIFTQLYNKGFIKSKGFSFTSQVYDLQNKLMHTIKSSVNKEVDKASDGIELFGKISFAGPSLKASIILPNTYGKFLIFKSKSANIIANATIGLNGVMMLSLNGGSLVYRFDGLEETINPLGRYLDASATVNLKEDLDSIVNCIMYVPASIKAIAEIIKECNAIDENYQFTLNDICHFLCGSNAPDMSRIGSEIRRYISEKPEIANEPIELTEDQKNIMSQLNPSTYYLYDAGLIGLRDYLKKEADRINGTEQETNV
jgi:hypothetical protein